MKISFYAAAAGVVLTMLIAGHAYPGKAGAQAVPKSGGTLKADQADAGEAAAPAASGSSVVERDKKRYENKQRAAERRAAQVKKERRVKPPAAAGSSVVERDKKRYEAKKKAAEQRAAEMKKAETAGQMKDAAGKGPADMQGQTPAPK